MTAYIIVEAVLHDPEKFRAYAALVPGIVAEFGGEYLVLGGEQAPRDRDAEDEPDHGPDHRQQAQHEHPDAQQQAAPGEHEPVHGRAPETRAGVGNVTP